MKTVKFVSIVCVLSMLLCLVSCGNVSEDTSSAPVSTESKTESETESETSTVSSKPAVDKTLWKRKMVAITIDDGPKDCTVKLLDGLKERNAKLTFFLLGENIDKNPDTVKRMIAEGHSIGWHSYGHNISSTSTLKQVEDDFAKAQKTLDNNGIDYKFKFYRNPGGQSSENIDKTAEKYGFRIFGWTNGSFNSDLPTAKEMCDSTYDGVVANGSVILIHDYNETVVDGILMLVDRIIADGFEVVNLDEIMKRRNGGNAGEHYATSVIY